ASAQGGWVYGVAFPLRAPPIAAVQTTIDGLRYLYADYPRLRSSCDVDFPGVEGGKMGPRRIDMLRTVFDKQALQFAGQRLADGVALRCRETAQNQFVNHDLDVRWPRDHPADIRRALLASHAQPPISASVSGFSSLANSTWAARSRWLMRTG